MRNVSCIINALRGVDGNRCRNYDFTVSWMDDRVMVLVFSLVVVDASIIPNALLTSTTNSK